MYKPVVDNNMLYKLGFSNEDINALNIIIGTKGKMSTSDLSHHGFTYQEIKRLQYLYAIVIGKIVVDVNDFDDISKHFYKLNANKGRVNINNLPLSNVGEVPSLAVIEGLPKGRYEIYNYSYKKKGLIHVVSKIGKDTITIRTPIKPVLPYGSEKHLYYYKDVDSNKIQYTEVRNEFSKFNKEGKKIDIGIAVKVMKLSDDKKMVDISINKRYVRLVKPYIIICSFTRPKSHLGIYKMVLAEGSKLFIYAVYCEGNGRLINNSTKRVYYWGYKKKQLPVVLKKIAESLYSNLGGVFVEFEAGQPYIPIEK